MKILVVNGPNLNLLGEREPSVYGDNSLSAINERLKVQAENAGAEITVFVESMISFSPMFSFAIYVLSFINFIICAKLFSSSR